MREEKRNRIIAAIVVNAILFVFILLGVVIAQWVTIGYQTRRKNELMKDYNETVATLHEMEGIRDSLEEKDEDFILTFYEMTDHYQTVRKKLEQLGVKLPPSEFEIEE